MTAEAPYVAGPLVDHHCHGLVAAGPRPGRLRGPAERGRAAGPLARLAVRLDARARRTPALCAPVLDLGRTPPPTTTWRAAASSAPTRSTRRLLGAAGIDTFLVDTGSSRTRSCSPDELAALAGRDVRAHEIVRLETIAERLLAAGTDPRELARARSAGAWSSPRPWGRRASRPTASASTWPPASPRDVEVVAALARRPARRARHLSDRRPTVIIGWLAWTALDRPAVAVPRRVRRQRRRPAPVRPPAADAVPARHRRPGVPVMLLHNYPFHRHAGYLAQVFDHVFMDVGLAVHNTGALSRRVVAETLELVPFGKLLYSSDAFGLAELYLLGEPAVPARAVRHADRPGGPRRADHDRRRPDRGPGRGRQRAPGLLPRWLR